MTDTLLNQQMSEAEKQIDERLKEAENIKNFCLIITWTPPWWFSK